MKEVRPGLLGTWDRFVGPGATRVENVGTVGLALAGAVLAPHLKRHIPLPLNPTTDHGARLTLRVMAVDLWGGAWCNNTPAAARWYGRDGQGLTQHLAFAAAHVHPFVLAGLERGYQRTPWWVWGAAHYSYLILATTLIRRGGRSTRRGLGLLATSGGVLLDRFLGVSPSAPWFSPVYYTKLLAGHVAGAAVLPTDPLQ